MGYHLNDTQPPHDWIRARDTEWILTVSGREVGLESEGLGFNLTIHMSLGHSETLFLPAQMKNTYLFTILP